MNSLLLATSLALSNPEIDIQIEKEEMTQMEKYHKKRKMKNAAITAGFIIVGHALIFGPLYIK